LSEQTRKDYAVSRRTATDQRDGEKSSSISRRGQVIKESLDDLLDDIDDLLEQNADEFLRGYVQRGGE
jgi:prokaryotic ubiquitin-like protein Pup